MERIGWIKGGLEMVDVRCKSVKDIVDETNRILFDELNVQNDSSAEYFFRGESLNFKRQYDGKDCALSTDFPCYVDRNENWYKRERELYHEAMRLNVVSFEKDCGMVERMARMQHYQLPTRFCDISSNVLVATLFACGGGDLWNKEKRDNGHDGYIRILKVRNDRMKSFSSDIITAIAHLPLVKAENINPSREDGLDYLRYEVTNSRPGFSMPVMESTGKGLRKAKEQLREEIQHVWAFKPVWNSDRIRGQFGAFLAFGCHDQKKPLKATFSLADYDVPSAPSYGIAQVAYIQINGKFKSRIREELRYFGVPIELLYADVSNVCSEISERVKTKGRMA